MSEAILHNKVAILAHLEQLVKSSRYQAAREIIEQLDETIFSSASVSAYGRYLSLKARVFFQLGHYLAALHAAEQGLALVKHSAENELIARLQSTMARSYAEIGKLNLAERIYRDLLATYRRIDDTGRVIRTLNRLARIAFIRSQFDRAAENLLEAKDYAEESGDEKAVAMILGNLGTVLNLTGEFSRAVEYLEQSIVQNMALRHQVNLCRAYLSLAYAQMHLKEFAAASDSLKLAGLLIDEANLDAETQQYEQYRAQYHLLTGDYLRALDLAKRAVALARENSDASSNLCQSERVLAEIELRLGHLRTAEKSAKRALQIAEEIGEDVETGACWRVLALIAATTGKMGQVAKSFRKATKRLADCGANFELAQTYLAASQTGGERHLRKRYLHEAEILFARLGLEELYLDSTSADRKPTADNVPLVGESLEFIRLVGQATVCAAGDVPILLLGETGTGKDQLAKYIHQSSDRADKPFIQVNCAAIPVELAESELFGYEKGAFTNAVDRKVGLIEAAEGGTLFLNEIGELPLLVQAKLLAVLDNKKFFKLGASRQKEVDFRLIAATNGDLEGAVENGTFRTDLYYRLAVLRFRLPRLVTRGADAFKLFEHFLETQKLNLNRVDSTLLNTLRSRMAAYSWPGNVRELKNYVELFTLTERRDVAAICQRLLSCLNGVRRDSVTCNEAGGLSFEVEQLERSRINSALTTCGGVIRRAAVSLSLPEATLRSKMKKYEISAA